MFLVLLEVSHRCIIVVASFLTFEIWSFFTPSREIYDFCCCFFIYLRERLNNLLLCTCVYVIMNGIDASFFPLALWLVLIILVLNYTVAICNWILVFQINRSVSFMDDYCMRTCIWQFFLILILMNSIFWLPPWVACILVSIGLYYRYIEVPFFIILLDVQMISVPKFLYALPLPCLSKKTVC